MRPLRLTLQAFGPYPDRVVIDFRGAVEAGLFGIYGQTGSGKSTIFSALTFALFGESAKSEQEAQSLRSDHADPDVITEVEFIFDIGDRRYVVFRRPDQMRPKTRGGGETRSLHEAYLFDATGMAPEEITGANRGRIVAEKKVREVDAAVTETLGYGSQQFRQIVLLPQGRFETFLSAKTKERIEILRELFDVSRYAALMASLKSEADTAEQYVREERALCARQLSAEGFESVDALIAGIKMADVLLADLQTAEDGAKTKAQFAENELRQAEAIEEKFAESARMNGRLAGLEAKKSDIEALGAQVRNAERARSLVDAEQRVKEVDREVIDAETTMQGAIKTSETAATEAEAAAEVLRHAEARSGEVDGLRRKQIELDRLSKVLEAAADCEKAVETTLQAQRDANVALGNAQAQLDQLQGLHTKHSSALKAAREKEALRSEILVRQASLVTHHEAAKTYETALLDVHVAQGIVTKQQREFEAATGRAESARQAFDGAEANLAAAQALHLATKLESGKPCPVCGATEHPAPATGEIGNAGLDKAFRESRDVWQAEDLLHRSATVTLAGLRATLDERKKRLSGLDQPVESAEVLAVKIANEDKALAALGPEVDIGLAETEIDGLSERIITSEQERNKLRDSFEECRNKATEARTKLDSKLVEVPGDLRAPGAVAAAAQQVSASLDQFAAATTAVDQAVRRTRDAVIGAERDLESARKFLATCQERRQRAVDAFQAKLSD